jgi:aryl-alcohol dehydrogenase-like predicted oxidoreductase
MRYVDVLGTELHLSAICLGSGSLGSTVPEPDAFALLDTFVERGGNFLDTAKVYADWLPGERSVSERTIGRWLASRGAHERVIVGTKGAHPELSTMHIPRLSRQEIVHDLESSLRNLQVEVVDLYWLHRDDPRRPVGEILETLHDQFTAGKVRYYGCSNWRVDRVRAAQAYAVEHGMTGFVADQMRWSLAYADPQASSDPTMVGMSDDLYAYHLDTGLLAVPYSSQAGGYFHKLDVGGHDRLGESARRAFGHAVNQERLARIQTLSRTTGLTVTQLVLGYLLCQPFPTIPIVGCKTQVHLLDSLSAADVCLAPQELRYLEGGSASPRAQTEALGTVQ